MKSRILILILLFALCCTGSVAAQTFPTPTANLDGKILYTVTENDSCLSIQLKLGVAMDVIKELNQLDDNCALVAGTRILLGIYETPTPTPGPSPTPTIALPTPTPFLGNATVCVTLFDDVNGNALSEETEYWVGGGAVSLSKQNGSENFTGLTTGTEPICFNEVPEGNYNISLAPPSQYNATTTLNIPLIVRAGDSITVNFGAQKQSAFEDQPTVGGPSKSPILAIAGIGFMLVGIGIVLIYGIMKKRG